VLVKPGGINNLILKKEYIIMKIDLLGSEDQYIVTIDDLELYFSYYVLIAFSYKGELFCSNNAFSYDTGDFLNEICPDKAKRLPAAEFNDWKVYISNVLHSDNILNCIY
jgi:hypothetical protein